MRVQRTFAESRATPNRSSGSFLNSVALCAFSVCSVFKSTLAMYGDMATQSLRQRSIPDTEDTEKAQRATEKGEGAIYAVPHIKRLAYSGSWVGSHMCLAINQSPCSFRFLGRESYSQCHISIALIVQVPG